MKWGSVRFFKCLILVSIGIMIIVPVCLSIYFGIQLHKQSKELLPIEIASAAEVSQVPLNDEYRFEYQELFPKLHVERTQSFAEDVPLSAYITFDDGPSSVTAKILDVLKEKGIKATFFVVYDSSPQAAELLCRMSSEGHSIGVHTTSHEYKDIYSSVEAYLKDFEITATWIEETTGSKPTIFRFPGGSINTYNQVLYQPLIAEMIRRGYVYYDWNISSGDSTKTATDMSIKKGVLDCINQKDRAIILFHDNCGNMNTVRALPEIIDQLKNSDRMILPLDNKVKPITFSYNI